MTAVLSDELIVGLPKVALHDHLDGGLRPATIVELADACGHALPTQDPEELREWFVRSADSGSLERYLETFEHTVAVMQTQEQLERVARECVLDQAADGVIYLESRYAPELHLARGLAPEAVVEAVQAGFEAGVAQAGEQGHTIVVGTLLTAIRHGSSGLQAAELTVAYRDQGVVGFDIAGAEAGFPPSRQLAAFDYLHTQNMHVTIHAGEAFGLPSIQEAVQVCGADRLGHGVRIMDDITQGEPGQPAQLGRLARWIRDQRIPLEMCPTSNVQTGAAPSIAQHPITQLKDLRFRVTLNTDNRLMSGTSMSLEMMHLVRDAGWTLEDLRWVTVNGMKSAFVDYAERAELIATVITPAYDEAARVSPPVHH